MAIEETDRVRICQSQRSRRTSHARQCGSERALKERRAAWQSPPGEQSKPRKEQQGGSCKSNFCWEKPGLVGVAVGEETPTCRVCREAPPLFGKGRFGIVRGFLSAQIMCLSGTPSPREQAISAVASFSPVVLLWRPAVGHQDRIRPRCSNSASVRRGMQFLKVKLRAQ